MIQADLVYARVGGTSLRLDLYTPSEAPSGLPTLLYLHGGGWAVGDKSDAAVERLMPIVANGFAVASVNYRLIPSVRYPSPVHDVKAAVRWLRANAAEYGLDPDRIAIGGVSAGGHLASLTGLTAGDAQLEGDVGDQLGVSSGVSAVVAYCPSSDFLLSGGRNALETQILTPPETAALLGLDRIDDDPELARSASPRHRVHAGAPPHLILHGDRDAMVNHEQSRVLHEALSAVGAQSIYVLIAGAGHEGPEFVAPAITATVAASTSTAGLELQSSARTRLSGGQGHHGSDDEEPQQGDLAVALPLLREEWLGTSTGLFGHRFLTNSGGRQCLSPPVKFRGRGIRPPRLY